MDILSLARGEVLPKSAAPVLLRMRNPDATSRGATFAIPLKKMLTGMGLSLTGHFMTSPSWVKSAGEIPARTQFFIWREEGDFGVLIPLLDGDYHCTLRGGQGGMIFDFDCGPAGQTQSEITVGLFLTGKEILETVRTAAAAAVSWMGRGNLRANKPTPKWMDGLGWCTWDAFYSQVDEEKILHGLRSFAGCGFHPSFLFIDDGWQDTIGKGYLLSFGTAPGKFTGDSLAHLVQVCREEFGLRHVGCWRTLFGGMRGVDPDSPGLSGLRRDLVPEPGTEKDTFGVVDLRDVSKFQMEYCRHLATQGIDLLKVDFQSALGLMTHEQAGRCGAAKIWQKALQDAVEENFGAEMLNCMSMAAPEVYHTPFSNIIRSSDDFFPTKDPSHPLHIRQNLFNSLWLSQVQWTDWDMFQSRHPWAEYHAVGRAISGGPVYVSDRPEETDGALLGRFVDVTGRVLRCPQPAWPVADRIFEDPISSNCFIRAANRCRDAGLVALFHPGHSLDAPGWSEVVEVSDFGGVRNFDYAVFSVRNGYLGTSPVEVQLGPREADLLVFSSLVGGFALFGLVEKWTPPASILETEKKGSVIRVRTRCGGSFGFVSEVPVCVHIDGRPAEITSLESGLSTLATPDASECLIEFFPQSRPNQRNP